MYYVNGTISKTTDFVGNFVYENFVPAYVLNTEGRVILNSIGTAYCKEVYLKDHLGNVRVALRRESGVLKVRQVDSYYPFGMNIKGLSVTTTVGIRPNEYLYNGKMMQDEMSLNWLDYGARFYDAVLGRFHSKDRFAEKYFSYSPYQYCFSNPLRFIDINGDSVRLTDAYKNNKQIMKGHNEWLKSDSGKDFMKLFGEGGKFENVSIVFDAVDSDQLYYKSQEDGEEGIELVNSEGKATDIISGPVSKGVIDAASGKGDGSYIRSTISINSSYNYSNNYLIAELAETDSHESQHSIIRIRSIMKFGINPSAFDQHSLMKNTNGYYFKTRYNSYWQHSRLWAPKYMEERDLYKKDVIKFVTDRVNNF